MLVVAKYKQPSVRVCKIWDMGRPRSVETSVQSVSLSKMMHLPVTFVLNFHFHEKVSNFKTLKVQLPMIGLYHSFF